MPDPIFADPRLARIYDAFEGDRSDLDLYVAVADECAARRVLDLGCGTGTLALRLAATGRTVVGVDPAAASLQVARAKPGASGVRWIHGDAGSLPPGRLIDLATMTGNVAQVFTTDASWAATLAGLHAALRPGGWLVFESRRPERRAWEDWAVELRPRTVEVPGVGLVRHTFTLTAVDLPLVSFRSSYRFPDGTLVDSDSTLRFRSLDELAADLAAHGFEVRDVRDAPDRPGLENVVLATTRTPTSGPGSAGAARAAGSPGPAPRPAGC